MSLLTDGIFEHGNIYKLPLVLGQEERSHGGQRDEVSREHDEAHGLDGPGEGDLVDELVEDDGVEDGACACQKGPKVSRWMYEGLPNTTRQPSGHRGRKTHRTSSPDAATPPRRPSRASSRSTWRGPRCRERTADPCPCPRRRSPKVASRRMWPRSKSGPMRMPTSTSRNTCAVPIQEMAEGE